MAQRNTTPDLPVYIADRSIEDIGRAYGAAINVYVHGFWSDVITIYVRRNYRYKAAEQGIEHAWQFEITHSSGGRDTDQVADDIVAHDYFAQGIMAACQYARVLRSQVAEIEKYAQLEMEKARREREAEEAAEKAAVAADPAMGEEAAAKMVADAAAKVTRSREITIYARPRGTSRVVTQFHCRAGRDAVTRFFKGSVMMKRIDVIAELATFATDSYIQQN